MIKRKYINGRISSKRLKELITENRNGNYENDEELGKMCINLAECVASSQSFRYYFQLHDDFISFAAARIYHKAVKRLDINREPKAIYNYCYTTARHEIIRIISLTKQQSVLTEQMQQISENFLKNNAELVETPLSDESIMTDFYDYYFNTGDKTKNEY